MNTSWIQDDIPLPGFPEEEEEENNLLYFIQTSNPYISFDMILLKGKREKISVFQSIYYMSQPIKDAHKKDQHWFNSHSTRWHLPQTILFNLKRRGYEVSEEVYKKVMEILMAIHQY